MPTNYKIWRKDVGNQGKSFTQDQFRLFQNKVALDTFKLVILQSPVGNPSLWKSRPPPGYVGGQFRGNWQISINSYNEGTTYEGTDSTGGRTISRESGKALTAPPFSVIYIHNNLPYAQALEHGHSTQAPLGIVAVVLENVSNSLRG